VIIKKENQNSDTKTAEEKQKQMIDALLKKAIGYQTKEIVEEFGFDDEGKVSLSKKKVQTKDIPPDTSAAKLLFELLCETSLKNVETMSDEELEEEKNRLLKEIEEL